ncbi:hypothetical protein B0T17DRAFT_577457 [Bombardia bombarda]|uniref:DUF6314 domain-containing protein n=1 Tax=Bombardia bombarda TaxID=252184 RepID=A0AA40C5A5_9PEZI|nr:hypothetical protein B0T17DRAFT_577457 [Bombardia bombarda]
MPKTVCIIGAGPAGITAAKSLLHDAPEGTFNVTILEAQTRIGGLWPSSRDDTGGQVHPLMLTNGSRHTVQFSDLAWEDDVPQLPHAWQVGRYLERYYEKYCQAATLHLGTRVESVDPLETSVGDETPSGWRVLACSFDGVAKEQTFDYLLVASGFFGKPVMPQGLLENSDVPILHSSKYRDLSGLLAKNDGKGGKILIVGGQMSGFEIAGTMATHLSSAVHTPDPSPIPNPDKYSLHHVTQRPVWVLPLYTSPKPKLSAPPFLPMDLNTGNIANRPQPLVNTQGHISPEQAKKVHGILQAAAGTDQSNFSPALAIKDTDTEKPPYLAISDYYMDFVRSGLISVSHGKLLSLTGTDATISSLNPDKPESSTISNIAAVVLATGFEASSSISFLPQAIRETLSVSPNDINNTIALAFHNTHHPAIPHLGFVGFYRSPYWTVMELQARFLTALWQADSDLDSNGSNSTLSPAMRAALASDTSLARTAALRADPARASQFPMGDFAWLVQQLAAALETSGLPPTTKMPRGPPLGREMDVLTPARYPPKSPTEAQQAEAHKSLSQAEAAVLAGVAGGGFVARAVFRSLLGEWRLERDLVSRLPSHPSGHFSGKARFLLREGTRDGREGLFDLEEEGDHGLEYLYIEEGDFKAANGLTFRATRRYVWRYDEGRDAVSVWFVKTDEQSRADYLFHDLVFEVGEGVEGVGVGEDGGEGGGGDDGLGWRANAGHLCIDDFYDVEYRFKFKAVNLKDWRLAYTVKGPKKDYTIDGVYTRV